MSSTFRPGRSRRLTRQIEPAHRPGHHHVSEQQVYAVAAGQDRQRRHGLISEEIRVFMRFQDLSGRYVMHCHNVVHEDHAMMVRFDVG